MNATPHVPAGWNLAPLGELCEIVAQQIDPRLPEFARLPHINGENVESGRGRLLRVRSAAEDGLISGKYVFQAGDVLYSKLRPYLRKVVVAEYRGVCSADMYPIRVKHGLIEPWFLAWTLLSENFTAYAERESRRARMPKLNREQLFKWIMAFPDIGEQRRLVSRLRDATAQVERARAAAEAQHRAAQAFSMAKLRAAFGSEAIREWSSRQLGDVSEIVSGVTLGRTLEAETTRKVPYLRVANVKDRFLDLSEVYETAATDQEVRRLRLQGGDLLLTEGGDPDKLGRGTCWRNEIAECIHQNHIFRVRLQQDALLPDFVSAQIGSGYGKAYFLAHAKQTTGIATINRRVLARFPVLIPSLRVQRDVVSRIERCQAQVKRVSHLLGEIVADLEALQAASLRRAFAGEL